MNKTFKILSSVFMAFVMLAFACVPSFAVDSAVTAELSADNGSQYISVTLDGLTQPGTSYHKLIVSYYDYAKAEYTELKTYTADDLVTLDMGNTQYVNFAALDEDFLYAVYPSGTDELKLIAVVNDTRLAGTDKIKITVCKNAFEYNSGKQNSEVSATVKINSLQATASASTNSVLQSNYDSIIKTIFATIIQIINNIFKI